MVGLQKQEDDKGGEQEAGREPDGNRTAGAEGVVRHGEPVVDSLP